MPSPIPKDPSTRARRNRTATAATLRAVPGKPVPELPGEGWHPMVIAWWDDLWCSPMASEYLDSDRHGLLIMATLIDAFWSTDPAKASARCGVAAELRQWTAQYGLSPIARRRLQWSIEQAEQASERTAQRRAGKSATAPADPRAALHGADPAG